MPIISIFFGIVIRMNFFDHAPPHLHAAYNEAEALFDIRTGEVIAGQLPTRNPPCGRVVGETSRRPDAKLGSGLVGTADVQDRGSGR